MIKLVWVGLNPANDGGHSSKAYTIRRRSNVVTCRWGPIEIRGGRGGRYSWLGKGPQVRVETFSSREEARGFVDKQTAKKMERGYQKLPWYITIHRPRPKP